MRTIETKVYKFNELSDTAKENAIDGLRDINVDYNWWEDDFLLDIVSPKKISKKIDEILANEGCVMFNWKQIYFDLDRSFYIQFVDLEIEDKYIDLFRQFLGIPKALWENVYYEFSNENNTYYDFVPNTYIIFEHQGNKDFTEKQWNILEKAQKKFDDLVFNAWQQLVSQYDYLISDESIIETIEINDYEFTEEGKLI
jgi:hypothetical protein